MRSKLILGFVIFWLNTMAFAGNSNNIAFFQTGISGKYGLIGVLLTNYYPEYLITNKLVYSVASATDSNSFPILDVFPLIGGTNINGTNFCNAVGIRGSFNEGVTNIVIITIEPEPIHLTIAPLSLQISNAVSTNSVSPILAYIWNNGQFGILPFDGNGNGGIGIQYTFSIHSDNFWNCYISDTNSSEYLRLRAIYSRIEFNSSGEFGVTSQSSTSNNIQNSLTAEVDYKLLADISIQDPWPSDARPRDAYPLGFLLSPAGFEWNREFTVGNYTPKIAFGGAIPYIDYPAKWWSQYFNITHNPGFPPTLFTGFTYASPIATETNSVSGVHERWDTEFIYDFPLANSISLRATFNSYIGLDHSLWAHFYQIGIVYYIGNTGKGGHGLFFGYANGAQPPSFNKVGSWRLGYSIQF